MSEEVQKPRKVLNGWVLLFAICAEVVALIFAGFTVALFGLFMFVLGFIYMVLSAIDNPKKTIDALKGSMTDQDGAS